MAEGNRSGMPTPSASPKPPVKPQPEFVEVEPTEEEQQLAEADASGEHMPTPVEGNHSVVRVADPKYPDGVEVVAIAPGYFNCSRRNVGDKFTVKNMSRTGQWMKCVNPVHEKERQKFHRERVSKEIANASRLSAGE